MKCTQLFAVAIGAVFLLNACSNDDNQDPGPPDNGDFPYEDGILVVHEGNFFGGNASVSFVSSDLTTVVNEIFKLENGVETLGDTGQGMAFDGEVGYIVVNNSQKVEVVDRYSFESLGTIGGPSETDFLNPRYMAIANDKGFVTNWGDGTEPDDDFIAVIDLATLEIETTIPVEEGPERILAIGNRVYVAHPGGFSQNNVISVIDATTYSVTTVVVGDVPNAMQPDASGNLWVLCGGSPSWTGNETAGSLVLVDTGSLEVTSQFDFADSQHPGYLHIDGEGETLYYFLDGSVYAMASGATTLPVDAVITGVAFYDMAVHGGRLYGVDAGDFAGPGRLEVYDLDDFSFLDSKTVSIIPGEIYFNGSY